MKRISGVMCRDDIILSYKCVTQSFIQLRGVPLVKNAWKKLLQGVEKACKILLCGVKKLGKNYYWGSKSLGKYYNGGLKSLGNTTVWG